MELPPSQELTLICKIEKSHFKATPCGSPYRSPLHFLLQASPVNHVKCHRLIDRLCFVFLLCHEKISCLHPCHFNLKIFTSLSRLGKGARARAGAGRRRAATYRCCTVTGVYSGCRCWFSRCWAPESNGKELHLVGSASGAAAAPGAPPRPRPWGLTQGRTRSSGRRGDVTFPLEAQRPPRPERVRGRGEVAQPSPGPGGRTWRRRGRLAERTPPPRGALGATARGHRLPPASRKAEGVTAGLHLLSLSPQSPQKRSSRSPPAAPACRRAPARSGRNWTSGGWRAAASRSAPAPAPRRCGRKQTAAR